MMEIQETWTSKCEEQGKDWRSQLFPLNTVPYCAPWVLVSQPPKKVGRALTQHTGRLHVCIEQNVAAIPRSQILYEDKDRAAMTLPMGMAY